MIVEALALCAMHTAHSPANMAMTINRPAAVCASVVRSFNQTYHKRHPLLPSATYDLWWAAGTSRYRNRVCTRNSARVSGTAAFA
jgi:hypothetical protein